MIILFFCLPAPAIWETIEKVRNNKCNSYNTFSVFTKINRNKSKKVDPIMQ